MTDNPHTFSIHSKRVLTPAGFQEATVVISNGKITGVITGSPDAFSSGVTDVGNLVVMPGLIDSHVHINEPGRSEWEGFETMTQAAIAGGITTLVDMPLNSTPVTTDVETFNRKLLATKGKLYCNCGFWGGIVPANSGKLQPLIDAGVLGIKAFLTHSGIDDFPNVTLEDLEKAMPAIANANIPLLAHAELDDDHEGIHHFEKNPKDYQAFLKSRPKRWEDNAVKLMIDLCKEHHARIHIVHLSSAGSLKHIQEARNSGLPLTVETCPQYLYFCAEEIPDGNTLFKCAPPIRERENNEKLWDALKNGIIDFIVTDHSPATPELKKMESGNLREAWGGIASIQFSLPVVWTAAQKHDCSLEQVAQWLSTAVAGFIGLGKTKGKIAKGYDADIVIWNPEEKFTVKAEDIYYRHKISPYIGEELSGVVKQTYVGGKKVFDGTVLKKPPVGEIIIGGKKM